MNETKTVHEVDDSIMVDLDQPERITESLVVTERSQCTGKSPGVARSTLIDESNITV